MKKFDKSYKGNTGGIYADKEFAKLVRKAALPLHGVKINNRIAFASIHPSTDADTGMVSEALGPISDGNQYKVAVWGAKPCHGALKSLPNHHSIAVLTRINDVCMANTSLCKRDAIKFYDFLFNVSPYAPAFLTKSGKQAFEQGFVLCRTDVPAPLMLGACIASRRVWQYPPFLVTLLTDALKHNNAVRLQRLWFLLTLMVGSTGVPRQPILALSDDCTDSALVKNRTELSWEYVHNFVLSKIHKPGTWRKWYHFNTTCPGVVRLWGKTTGTSKFATDLNYIEACATQEHDIKSILGGRTITHRAFYTGGYDSFVNFLDRGLNKYIRDINKKEK